MHIGKILPSSLIWARANSGDNTSAENSISDRLLSITYFTYLLLLDQSISRSIVTIDILRQLLCVYIQWLGLSYAMLCDDDVFARENCSMYVVYVYI